MCYDCCGKNGVLFKISLLGVMTSFALALLGILPPLNMIFVPIPMAWLLAIVLLLPSITLYFNVKDAFWADVEKCHRKKKK
ncbi:MAG: hypothetical protein KKD39_03185 [Candidatus Altiarchaeota archaeon]|nr:hypothetical protein [Candidatus Altiarchaeota archaeon]